jgi:transposase
MHVSTVGLDIAKNVFQVHGVDDHGRTVLRRKVHRDQLLKLFNSLEPCLSAWRRARRRTTGLVNLARLGIRYG